MYLTLWDWSLRELYPCLYLAVVLMGILPVSPAGAQQISVDIVAESLPQALDTFAAENRINLVYAQRQVSGRLTTCSYRGAEIDAALACILSDQTLQVVRLKRKLYVLVESNVAEDSGVEEVQRGTLHGFVIDADSKETLPGANVYLPEFFLGTATNEAGYYAIPSLPNGQYRTRISYLGYSTLDTLFEISRESATIQLHRQTLESISLLISGDRRDLNEVDPGVRQIPMERIARLPGSLGEADLLQSLNWLPSVQRIRTKQGGLVIRGGEPDQVHYLIDGAPVYHMWHVGGLLSTYQSEAFKDVRLYRGSFPAEHGGRLSGVLDAELKDGSLGRITGLAGIGLLSARVLAEGPISKRLSFMISGRRSYLDRIIGRTHPVDDGVRKDTMRTGIYLYDVSTKLAWRPSEKQRLTLGVYGSADVLDIRLPVNLSLVNASSSLLPLSGWLRPASLILEFDTRWSNRLISGRYHYLYSDQLFLSATAYATSYRAYERIFIQPTATSSVNSRYGVNILDIGAKLDLDYYWSLAHHFRIGISFVQRQFFSELKALILQTNIISQRTDQRSELDNVEIVFYAQDTWTPTSKLQIQPGLRVSQLIGGNDLRVSPRLGVRYEMDRMTLRFATGVNVQYIHQVRDRYSVLYDLISYRWVPASHSVDPSHSYHASLGGHIFLGRHLSADLTAYIHFTEGFLLPRNEKQSKDRLLGPGIGFGSILGQYTRGRAFAHGVETNLQYNRGPYSVWISYAAGRSRNRAPLLSEASLRPARYDVPQRFQVSMQRTTKYWMFGISGQVRSGYPITVPEARYAVGDPLLDEPQGFFYLPKINNGRLPPYTNLGLQGAYQFEWGPVGLQFKLEINNLTFRRNVIRRIYDPMIPERVSVASRYGFPAYPLLEITARF